MDNHRDDWTLHEEEILRRMYGWFPLSRVAEELGRTPGAVDQKRRHLHIPALRNTLEIMLIGQFAEAMGLRRQAARRLADSHRFSATMYEGDREVTAVLLGEFTAWLRDPLNWRDLDVEKIEHLPFREIVEEARENGRDRWLTARQAAEQAGYSIWGMLKMVRQERLPAEKGSLGRKGNELWLIKESTMRRLVDQNRVVTSRK